MDEVASARSTEPSFCTTNLESNSHNTPSRTSLCKSFRLRHPSAFRRTDGGVLYPFRITDAAVRGTEPSLSYQ